MHYQLAERFKSIQGEGVYAGTPMAFIRFVGCSVGKTVCSACDTDFEVPVPWRGGGTYSAEELAHGWVKPYSHVCLTGGEPLDQDLTSLLRELLSPTYSMGDEPMVHIETSGTINVAKWLADALGENPQRRRRLWICVSPKPGWLEQSIAEADEVKVIMPGLGVFKNGAMQPAKQFASASTEGGPLILSGGLPWPTLQDALRWAANGKTVFLQPRNGRNDLDMANLRLCQDIIVEHPQLRLSVQLHKILKVQ